MGIPDYLTWLLRNLYTDQEATVRMAHETMDWFQTGKGACQDYISSPCLFSLHAEYIIWNARLDEEQAGIRTAKRWRWEIWSWLMPLLVPIITILMLLMTAPCIINCQTHFVSTQVNKLQHAVPVQQGYIKLQLATENITHLYMDTTIKTLRLETSQRWRPNALCHPSSTGSNQKDLDAPIPKESGLPSLKGEC